MKQHLLAEEFSAPETSSANLKMDGSCHAEVWSYLNDLIIYHSEIEDQDFQKVSIKVQTKEAVYNLRLFQWKFKASLNTAVHTLNKGMYIVNGEEVNHQMFGNVSQIIITNDIDVRFLMLLDFVV